MTDCFIPITLSVIFLSVSVICTVRSFRRLTKPQCKLCKSENISFMYGENELIPTHIKCLDCGALYEIKQIIWRKDGIMLMSLFQIQ